MNKEHLDIDALTKELLKKSLQKPASSNFDDQLMNKIMLSPSPEKLKSNGTNLRKAWIFMLIAVACLLTTAMIIGQLSDGYFINISTLLSITINWVFYGGLILFIPLFFYHFDSLMQTMILKRNEKIMVS